MDKNQEVRYDSLGRRIPVYDRKAAAKKRTKTIIKKYGEGFFSDMGIKGGKTQNKRKGGWLRELKYKDPELLQEIVAKGTKNAAKKRTQKAQANKKNRQEAE